MGYKKQHEIQGGLDRILYLVSCISYLVSRILYPVSRIPYQMGSTATAIPT